MASRTSFLDLPARVVLRQLLPVELLRQIVRARSSRARRVLSAGALFGFWSVMYARYRAGGVARTAEERELLRKTSLVEFDRHYNEQVVTIEEEFEIWGPYHQHRHEMRYDHVAAAVRKSLPAGGIVLDVGCGAGMVADRIGEMDATYIGVEYSGRNAKHAADKLAGRDGRLRTSVGRCDAERLPFADATVDVVVMSEVIEHLLGPDQATWEVARVLKPGGVLVMTTNNASEVPCRSPLTHLFAWLEKALGAMRPSLISYRPWVWPEKVAGVLDDGSDAVYLPHTHHIYAETRDLFAAAGLVTHHWSTFEFPPAQAQTSSFLEGHGARGRAVVDRIEQVCTTLPLMRRMGAHHLMVAHKEREPVSPEPTPGLWPGPVIPRVPVAH